MALYTYMSIYIRYRKEGKLKSPSVCVAIHI